MGEQNLKKIIKTLIVDDSSDFLEVEKGFLSMEPHIEIIGEALTGMQSIEMTLKLKPDLVLMDLALPDISGIEATKKIKETENPPYVVILTLYDNPEYKGLAEKSGADGFITKSEFATRLITVINNLFYNKEREKREKEQIKMKNILIADDSATMRKMIMACLKHIKGAKFVEASNGLEAIEQIVIKEIDLVTLDLNMPDVHGLEVLNFIRRHDKFKNIPVVVITTKKDDTSRKAALDLGTKAYITKPFKPEELLHSVEKILKEEDRMEVLEEQNG